MLYHSSIFHYFRLNEGEGQTIINYLGDYSTLTNDNNILWKHDTTYLTICPSSLVPVKLNGSENICCEESYLKIPGQDAKSSEISFQKPGWSTDGSLCFYLLKVDNADIKAGTVLVDVKPLSITFSQANSEIILEMHINKNRTMRLRTKFQPFTWSSFCFGFTRKTPEKDEYLISSSFPPDKFSTALFSPAHDLTPYEDLKILKGYTAKNVFIKNVLLLSKSITHAEHITYFWGKV